MKNPSVRQGRRPLHIRVQVMMLENDIPRTVIMQRLNMSKSLLSKALKGKRLSALQKVFGFVRSYRKKE